MAFKVAHKPTIESTADGSTDASRDEQRVTTAVRIPESLFERLKEAAAARDTSVNHLLVRGADYYIRRLPPLDPADDPIG
jgi:predicted HicB family RNase H-like nuclease